MSELATMKMCFKEVLNLQIVVLSLILLGNYLANMNLILIKKILLVKSIQLRLHIAAFSADGNVYSCSQNSCTQPLGNVIKCYQMVIY